MTSDLPEHEFDPERAAAFRPKADFSKTAILVEPAAPDAVVVLKTQFGEQRMQGAFYAVAEGSGSYGAARAEFEAAHEQIGPNRWVKRTPIRAYEADEPTKVVTRLGSRDGEEATVVARPGDWIVQQSSGEVVVVTPPEFEARYEPADA